MSEKSEKNIEKTIDIIKRGSYNILNIRELMYKIRKDLICMAVVRGFVGLVGSVHFTYCNGEKLATYGLGAKGDIRFEVENNGRLKTVSLTQVQLKEAVEQWLNRLDSQSTVEPLVLSIYN